MAAGELVSVRAQDELVEHEVEVERQGLRDDPGGEESELAAMYRVQGVPDTDAKTVARILMANTQVALDTRARLELGVDPDRSSSANQAAVASFFAFAAGALVPPSGQLAEQHRQQHGAHNALPGHVIVSLICQTEVAADDPAFAAPTKFVRPVYSQPEAERLAAVRAGRSAPTATPGAGSCPRPIRGPWSSWPPSSGC